MAGSVPANCWVVAWLLLVIVVCDASAMQINPCSTTNSATGSSTATPTYQVEHNSQDVLLACEDFSLNLPLTWTWQGTHPSDAPQIVANCAGSTCQSVYNVLIKASINQHTRRSHVILPDVLRDRFPDGHWWCSQTGGSSAQCDLDVIRKPENSHCTVTVDEGRGMVTGECQMSKMFSSQGDYACTWFEGSDNQTEVAVHQSLTQLSLTNCSEGAVNYFCGNCSFHKSLPLNNNNSSGVGYSYRAVISPGGVFPLVRYVVVPKQGNGASPSPSSPAPLMTPSSSSSSSMVTSQPSSQPVTSSQIPPVHDDTPPDGVWIYRFEGLGLGVPIAAAIIGFIILLVVICRRRRRRQRQRQEEEEGRQEKGKEDIKQLGDATDIKGVRQTSVRTKTPHPSPLSPHSYLTAISASRVSGAVDNEYSTIDPPEARRTGEEHPSRRLPPLPAESTVVVDNTESSTYLTPKPKSGPEREPGYGNGYVNGACRDNSMRQDGDLSLPGKRYECMGPPYSHLDRSTTKRKNSFHALDQISDTQTKTGRQEEEEKKSKNKGGKYGVEEKEEEGGEEEEEDRAEEAAWKEGRKDEGRRKSLGEEEEENLKNERTEKITEEQFIESAFRERGDVYIYMRNEGIPISDPI